MDENNEYLTLTQAAQRIPGRPHVHTVTRWVKKGVGEPKIRLESVKIGGRRYTTQRFIEQFIYALSNRPCPLKPDWKARRRAIDEAEDELDAEGF